MTNPASATPPPEPQGEIVVSVFGRTDVGRTREHNEDAFVVADLTTDNATLQPEVRQHVLGPKGTLFMVAGSRAAHAVGDHEQRPLGAEDVLPTAWAARLPA